MDFKDEYKNEMQNISPTEEQCERIRSGVMRKLSETAPVKKKKPLYFKIAAVSGAAVCAAAVVIVIFAGTHSALHISGSKNMIASPTDPGKGMTGGAANDGNTSDFSFDGSYSSVIDCAPNSEKNESPHSTLSSSYDYSQNSGDQGNDTPPMEGMSDSPYLTFSGDKSSCVVTRDGAAYTYYTSEDHIAGSSSEDKAVAADSNLDMELFVQFDENIMTVFSKDGSLFGVYIK